MSISELRETIPKEAAGARLDSYLAERFPTLSRSRIQQLIKNGQLSVDQQAVKPSYQLLGGEQVVLLLEEAAPIALIPQDIALDIVYEDADLVVVNKPPGMVVHPAAGHQQGTLVNALLYHCRDLSGINGALRPGIVHRIDKDTSGLVVAAKNDAAHQGLAEQWKVHSIKRVYQALLHGVMAENGGTIDAPIGRHPRDRKKMAVETKHGRPAITHYRLLERFAKYSHVECELETGRTHQIRVHMAHLGHPVAGDPVYGPRKQALHQGQLLHARVIGFRHPRTGEDLEFSSELPAYFQEILAQLRTLP